MIGSEHIHSRIIANTALALPLICAAGIAYLAVTNIFTKSTEFKDPYVDGPSTVAQKEQVCVRYEVIRYRSGKLAIDRLFRRPDGREILLQHVVQHIHTDNPPVPRKSGYCTEIPVGILNSDEIQVTGEVFSRVQYYNNILDWVWPRFMTDKTGRAQSHTVTVTVTR